MLTPDDIKKGAALAAKHAGERAELAGRQANEREALIEQQKAEAEASGIGKPQPPLVAAPPPKKARR